MTSVEVAATAALAKTLARGWPLVSAARASRWEVSVAGAPGLDPATMAAAKGSATGLDPPLAIASATADGTACALECCSKKRSA